MASERFVQDTLKQLLSRRTEKPQEPARKIPELMSVQLVGQFVDDLTLPTPALPVLDVGPDPTLPRPAKVKPLELPDHPTQPLRLPELDVPELPVTEQRERDPSIIPDASQESVRRPEPQAAPELPELPETEASVEIPVASPPAPELPTIVDARPAIEESATVATIGVQIDQPPLPTLPEQPQASEPAASHEIPVQDAPKAPELPKPQETPEFDPEWVESVISQPAMLKLPKVPPGRQRPGHGSFKLDDMEGDYKDAQERASEEYSSRGVISAIQEMQSDIHRHQSRANRDNLATMEQMAQDLAADALKVRELQGGFMFNRTTLSDTSI